MGILYLYIIRRTFYIIIIRSDPLLWCIFLFPSPSPPVSKSLVTFRNNTYNGDILSNEQTEKMCPGYNAVVLHARKIITLKHNLYD